MSFILKLMDAIGDLVAMFIWGCFGVLIALIVKMMYFGQTALFSDEYKVELAVWCTLFGILFAFLGRCLKPFNAFVADTFGYMND